MDAIPKVIPGLFPSGSIHVKQIVQTKYLYAMLTRYWRNLPWFLQLFLFVMMILIFTSLGTAIILGALPRITGIPYKSMIGISATSPLNLIRVSLFANTLNSILAFALPALLFAYFTHPRPLEYLGLRLPGKPVHWLLVAAIMLGFLPLSLYCEAWLQQHVHLGATARASQDLTDNTFAAYLNMKSPADLIFAFIGLAIIPPIGEELLFRGILMRFAHTPARLPLFTIAKDQTTVPRKRRMLMPIIITSVLFALLHSNPYGRILIFLAGAVLAIIYWLTGSLACSIWGHFLFNGTQVILAYLSRRHVAVSPSEEALPLWAAVAGALVFAGGLLALYQTRTPLPDNWSSDFAPDETKD